jgi:hypothetical protein
MATKLDRKIATLKKTIEKMPEYIEVLKLLPPNHTISLSIEESATTQKLNDHVEYRGFAPEGGQCPYLLHICELSYFESSKSLLEIANEIETVVIQEQENPTIEFKKQNWKGYSEDLRISLRLSDLFGATDEVYPHMHDMSLGSFTVNT